jgi:hypothetical protein
MGIGASCGSDAVGQLRASLDRLRTNVATDA